ncbi:50S ribosomal protein L11 methyltransferase [Salibacterium halotolerans]|uniref:Ribosomal protein L11 methyltransferase n=1 Tax=Salibacterium halotolerans TaxID=1884432 RepID=A0A1I5NFD9_9BACI|nr:50S ribosomal protein L11 methyltransferase [Salibacterium halotolerans]SFP20513.1 ribosomal protein L11 methyltransferase [Salibacterium halotolerans]
MKWLEFRIHTTQEAVEPISNILHESGASGVVIEDSKDLYRDWDGSEDEIYNLKGSEYPEEGVVLKSYFSESSFVRETLEEIKQSINDLLLHDIDIGRNEVTITEVEEEDWAHAWKQYYKPVKVTDTLTITPSWEPYVPENSNEKVIELDPGMAFGTGTHPTTVLCLSALEHEIKGGEKVIDVGTGSGVLAVGAAKFGAAGVTALDLDQTAVEAARENTAVNQVENTVTVKQNNLLDHETHQADIIVANILADIIIRLTSDAWKSLKPGGLFITSGIISGKKKEVMDNLEKENFEILRTQDLEDWTAVTAVKKQEREVRGG